MAFHSVHLSFTANLSPTEPKVLGCVERITVDLLILKNLNPHVKKLEVLLQIRSCQQQNMKFRQLLWSSTCFAKYFMKVSWYCIAYATISLVVVRDQDTVKEKKCFFSVQVLFVIPIEQSELAENQFSTGTCGRVTTQLHVCSHKATFTFSSSVALMLGHCSPYCFSQIQQKDYSSFK